jgi:hypothetical protein
MNTTRPNKLSLLALAAALAIPALAAGPARAQDEEAAPGTADVVHLADGKKRTGEIEEEFATKVRMKVQGQTVVVKREDIARIEYRDFPPQFGEVERAIARGDGDAAAKAAQGAVEAADGGKLRPLFKAPSLLRLGRALIAAQKYGDAGDAFLACCNAAPAGPCLRDAVREGARAYIRSGDAKKASDFIEKAKDWVKKAELPDEAVDEVSLLGAEAMEALGKMDDARMAYSLLTNSKDARVRGRASLGAARGALQSKDVERAEGKFKEILADKDVERSVKCGAARGLGDAILARPGAKKEPEKLRAAASAYAQALAVAFPGRDEPTADREAALVSAADVYETLASLSAGEKESKARELYQTMARQLREELVRLYKNSPLRAEVEQKLGTAAATGEGTKQ